MLKSSFCEDNNYNFLFPKLVDEEEATNKSFGNQTEQHKSKKTFFYKGGTNKNEQKVFKIPLLCTKLENSKKNFF
jgi:hypothetical protein